MHPTPALRALVACTLACPLLLSCDASTAASAEPSSSGLATEGDRADAPIQSALTLSRAEADAALAMINEWVARAPEFAPFMAGTQAQALARSGRFDEAAALIEGLEGAEHQAMAYGVLAVVTAKMGQDARAAEYAALADAHEQALRESGIENEMVGGWAATLTAVHDYLGNIERVAALTEQYREYRSYNRALFNTYLDLGELDAARELADTMPPSRRGLDPWYKPLALAHADRLVRQGDRDAAAEAFLTIAMTEAGKYNARFNEAERTAPADSNLTIQAIGWLATHGYTDQLAAQWPKDPPNSRWLGLMIHTAATALALDGEAGAAHGVDLLNACELGYLAPAVYDRAGQLHAYREALTRQLDTVAAHRTLTQDELLSAASQLLQAGYPDMAQLVLQRIPEEDVTLEIASMLAHAGLIDRGIALGQQAYDRLLADGLGESQQARSRAQLAVVRAYLAQALWDAGEIDAATVLFDACLADCVYLRQDGQPETATSRMFEQVLKMRQASGDRAGTANFFDQLQAEPLKQRFASYAGSSSPFQDLIQEKRFDEIDAVIDEQMLRQPPHYRYQIRLSVARQLFEAGHTKQAITFLNPGAFQTPHLGAAIREAKFEAVQTPDLWRHRNALVPIHNQLPGTLGLAVITAGMDVFDLDTWVELFTNARGRGLLTFARMLDAAGRSRDVVPIAIAVGEAVDAQTFNPEGVAQVMDVLIAFGEDEHAAAIGQRYMESAEALPPPRGQADGFSQGMTVGPGIVVAPPWRERDWIAFFGVWANAQCETGQIGPLLDVSGRHERLARQCANQAMFRHIGQTGPPTGDTLIPEIRIRLANHQRDTDGQRTGLQQLALHPPGHGGEGGEGGGD